MGQEQIKKIIKGKTIFKHETAAVWDSLEEGKQVNYIPEAGEMVLYDPPAGTTGPTRIKFGDGVNYVRNLPFSDKSFEEIMQSIEGRLLDNQETLRPDIYDYPIKTITSSSVMDPEYKLGQVEITPNSVILMSEKADYDYDKGEHIHKTTTLTVDKNGVYVNDVSIVTEATSVGKKGTGINAEIFNDYRTDTDTTGNIASGSYSHAEGENTFAEGANGAHAEGRGTQALGTKSHAEGEKTTAKGPSSHAEGEITYAAGNHSHVEGYKTETYAADAHAEGYQTLAVGTYSHAEGQSSTANNKAPVTAASLKETWQAADRGSKPLLAATATASHAEGSNTLASGTYSHAEGRMTQAAGNNGSHAEGNQSWALGGSSHAEGYQTTVYANNAHAEGLQTTVGREGGDANNEGSGAHAEGKGTKALANSAHAEGERTTASGVNAHAEGVYTIAVGSESHAEGYQTTAFGAGAHAEGRSSRAAVTSDITAMEEEWISEYYFTAAAGIGSHAEGHETFAQGDYSHTEGYHTRANALYAHAEGMNNSVTGSNGAHVEGKNNYVSGSTSHGEGYGNTVSGSNAHVEGSVNNASGNHSHAEGNNNVVSGQSAHVEGVNNIVSGNSSHGEGEFTKATSNDTHSEGYWTEAAGWVSHAEGAHNKALASTAHVEGGRYRGPKVGAQTSRGGGPNIAYAPASHVEGTSTRTGNFVADPANATVTDTEFRAMAASHAEGQYTIASGLAAHAEGSGYTVNTDWVLNTTTGTIIDKSGDKTCEGIISGTDVTVQPGDMLMLHQVNKSGARYYGITVTKVEGDKLTFIGEIDNDTTAANNIYNIQKIVPNIASGNYSHTSGLGTIAKGEAQTVVGKYNQESEDALFIVGCGEDADSRSNAFVVKSDNTAELNNIKIATINDIPDTSKFVINHNTNDDGNETVIIGTDGYGDAIYMHDIISIRPAGGLVELICGGDKYTFTNKVTKYNEGTEKTYEFAIKDEGFFATENEINALFA